jgi:hypothetical protein
MKYPQGIMMVVSGVEEKALLQTAATPFYLSKTILWTDI